MIEWIKSFFKKPLPKVIHRHDYEMEFNNPKHPLDYELICSCGDKAENMQDAIRKMSAS